MGLGKLNFSRKGEAPVETSEGGGEWSGGEEKGGGGDKALGKLEVPSGVAGSPPPGLGGDQAGVWAGFGASGDHELA